MDLIRLLNTERRSFSFNLLHKDVCARAGECFCHRVEIVLPGGKRVNRLDPACVRINGKERSEPLPAIVKELDPVVTRIRAGKIRVLSEKGYAAIEVVKPEE